MPAIAASTAALLISVALVWTANGLCFTLLALRMGAEGFLPSEIGMTATGYFAGQFFGALLGSRIIEKVGHVRAFAAFASLISASVIGYALHVDLVTWALLRGLHGFCIAGALMVAESWLNGATSNRGRGRLLAVYTIIQYVAMSAGQQLLHLHTPTGFVLFTIASILFSLALLPLVLSPSVQTGAISHSALRFRELMRISPLGVVGCFAAGTLVATLHGLIPVYLGDLGFTVYDIAMFISLMILGGLVVQYPIGKASDIFDRRTVIVVVLFAGALVCLATVIVPEPGFWTLVGLTSVYGGITYAIYPLAVSHANDYLDPVDLIAASAGLIMAMAAGAAFGPFVGSLLMEAIGSSGLYVFSGAVCLLLGGFAAYRMTRRPAPAAAEQGPYVLIPRTTTAAVALDPRADTEAYEAEQAEAAAPDPLHAVSAP